MKLLFLLGARSEWGYIRPLILEANKRGHTPLICATNMIVQTKYAEIINEINNLEIQIPSKITSAFAGDNYVAMAKSIGTVTSAFADTLNSTKPDWVILAGDRYEQLGAAVASSYMYVPTAHVQSGEKSGNIDGVARHAITKLVHLHFTSNADATDRVIKLGEQKFRIHETGAPQLDSLLKDSKPTLNELINKNIAPKDRYLLVIFHPVTEHYANVIDQVKLVKETLDKVDLKKIWILPNNDAGGDEIRNYILSNATVFDKILNNVDRPTFATLLQNCVAIFGNSSSGILEAPSFHKPAVNIGSRQKNRFRGANVIDIDFNEDSIISAIEKCQNEKWVSQLKFYKNPYGDGNSSSRIIDVLESVPTDSRLLVKELEY